MEISSDLAAEAGLSQIVATMEFLAAMAAAGNRLVVTLEKLDEGQLEDPIVNYLGDCGRAVNARDAALGGVREVRQGACRFEVG